MIFVVVGLLIAVAGLMIFVGTSDVDICVCDACENFRREDEQ